MAAIVGQLTLSGDEFKRQLGLGHSSYTLIRPELGFITFVGLHDVADDGSSGRFFWMMMRPDPKVADADHWLQTASLQDKHDHAMAAAAKLPPRFREIFELTPVSGMRDGNHVWRDLELADLPAGRIVLMGDAAHAMTPFRGEGGYHTFLDAMSISKALVKLNEGGHVDDIKAVQAAVTEYNTEMLDRGGKSVRSSRESYEEAKKKAENRAAFLAPIKPIADAEIVNLEVRVKA